MTTVKDRTSGVSIDSHDDGSVNVRSLDGHELAFTQEEFEGFAALVQDISDES